MAKKPNLQAALMGQSAEEARPSPTAAKPEISVVPPPAEPRSTRSPSRAGKKQIAAWLNPDFDRSLLLVMAKSAVRKDRQTLIAEALNDLFAKYNVPTVRD